MLAYPIIRFLRTNVGAVTYAKFNVLMTCTQQYKTSYSSEHKQSLSFSEVPEERGVIGACNKLVVLKED